MADRHAQCEKVNERQVDTAITHTAIANLDKCLKINWQISFHFAVKPIRFYSNKTTEL